MELIKEKLELLLNDLRINQQKEQEDDKSYFNTNLIAVRVTEILNICNFLITNKEGNKNESK